MICFLLISLLSVSIVQADKGSALAEDIGTEETNPKESDTEKNDTDRAEEEKEKAVYFCFYLDKDMTKLEAESYEPAQEETEYMLRELMQLLGSKNPDGKKIDLLPEEVTINSYELQKGILAIDFNEQYEKMGRVREILVRAGVVKTFLQVPGVASVRFTVNGEELTDSKNQPVGEMTADTFLEYSEGTDVSEYRFDTLTLYFTDASGKVLVPEKRNVYYRQNLQKERVVLEQLARGPMMKGNLPTIPGNVSVQSVLVSDGICYVTLDDSFIDYAQKDLPEEIPIYSVVNSILASCGETKVELTVGNRANRTFGDNMELYRFYEFRQDLVAEETEES